MRMKLRIEPELVRGGYRAHGGLRMPLKHNTRHVLAVDCLGDRSPEVRRTKPRFLVVWNRGRRDLVKPHELRVERNSRVTNERRLFCCNLVVNIGTQRINKIDFAAQKTQNFRVLILQNVEPYRVEIRELTALRIAFPVVGIPSQDQI